MEKMCLFGCCVFISKGAVFGFVWGWGFFLTMEPKAALRRFKAQISLSGMCRKKVNSFCPVSPQMQNSDGVKFHLGSLVIQEDLVIPLYL